MQDHLLAAAELLPAELGRVFMAADNGQTEEIRLRRGYEPTVLTPEGESVFARGHFVSGEELMRVLDRASGCSLHSYREQLRQGFMTAKNGIRIGVCGQGVGSGGQEGIRDFSSLALRIPRQIKGVGAQAISELGDLSRSVLIVSPPGGGKTTFLRELVRRASQAGKRVSVCDERGELAAVHQGKAGFDLGKSTDILCGVDKAAGMLMLLRAMNPQIIAVDEISAQEDIISVERSACCGAAIYATAHASGLEQMRKRALYARLLDLGVFDAAVVISGRGECRRYEVVRL